MIKSLNLNLISKYIFSSLLFLSFTISLLLFKPLEGRAEWKGWEGQKISVFPEFHFELDLPRYTQGYDSSRGIGTLTSTMTPVRNVIKFNTYNRTSQNMYIDIYYALDYEDPNGKSWQKRGKQTCNAKPGTNNDCYVMLSDYDIQTETGVSIQQVMISSVSTAPSYQGNTSARRIAPSRFRSY